MKLKQINATFPFRNFIYYYRLLKENSFELFQLIYYLLCKLHMNKQKAENV